MKRFKSNLYTQEKYVYRNKRWQYVSDDNDYLYSQSIYPTKIKAKDLPDWYVYGRYYKCFGYMSAKGVVDLKYVPNKFSNHFLKDDCLMVSYNKPIVEVGYSNFSWDKFKGYDERMYGDCILSFLKAARKHSNCDITKIIKMLKEKVEWLPKAFPDEFGDFKFDIDEYFSQE